MHRVLILAVCVLLVSPFIACGGGSNTSTTTSSSAPAPGGSSTTGSTPPPAPSPSPASDSFFATMFDTVGRNSPAVGQVTIDSTANNGAGNLLITKAGVGDNQSMVLQFCPYPKAFNGCFTVTTFATDATGSANVNFTFPQKGAYAGLFNVIINNTGQVMASGTGSTGMNFSSALLPAGTITGGIDQTTGSAPGSGSVVMNGTTAHIVLSGTTPNNKFTVTVCGIEPQTPCPTLSNVTTDAQGNASIDVGTVQPSGWSTFRLSDSNGVEFVSAFRVQ